MRVTLKFLRSGPFADLNPTTSNLRIILLLLLCVSTNVAADVVKHVDENNHRDQHKPYYVALLQLALEKSQPKFGDATLQAVESSKVFQRRLKNLNQGELDVIWSMTTEQKEIDMLPIRIPIFKGLIGFRVMVIQDIKQQALSHTTSTQQLKNMLALQGKDWLDADILRANGFKVETSDWYASLYKGLNKGLYDYFPRSVLEPWTELQTHQYANLVVEKQHLLYYPTAMYYFVQKDNQVLAQRIEFGLNQAIEDGSFDHLLYNYPAHLNALSKSNINSRIVHKLSNPFLPKSVPLADKRLWHSLRN